MYVELKSGHGDSGPAWIGWVKFSKTGRTVYTRGLELQRMRGGGISGNHMHVETGDEYWVSREEGPPESSLGWCRWCRNRRGRS